MIPEHSQNEKRFCMLADHLKFVVELPVCLFFWKTKKIIRSWSVVHVFDYSCTSYGENRTKITPFGVCYFTIAELIKQLCWMIHIRRIINYAVESRAFRSTNERIELRPIGRGVDGILVRRIQWKISVRFSFASTKRMVSKRWLFKINANIVIDQSFSPKMRRNFIWYEKNSTANGASNAVSSWSVVVEFTKLFMSNVNFHIFQRISNKCGVIDKHVFHIGVWGDFKWWDLHIFSSRCSLSTKKSFDDWRKVEKCSKLTNICNRHAAVWSKKSQFHHFWLKCNFSRAAIL